MDAVGDHQRLVGHAAGLADRFDLGVHPQVGVGARQRPLAEHAHLLIQAATQPGDLVLAQVVQAELLDQPVDLGVDTPLTEASWTTATSACSARRRGSKQPGK